MRDKVLSGENITDTLHGNMISVNTFSSVCNQSTVELFDIVLTTMYATLEDLEIYRYAL